MHAKAFVLSLRGAVGEEKVFLHLGCFEGGVRLIEHV